MRQTTKRSTALYDHLNNHQKASLCFNLTAIGQHEEADAVAGTVERRTYQMRDAVFLDSFDELVGMAAMFGLYYWQLETRRTFAVGALLALDCADAEDDDEKAADLLQLSRQVSGQQAALVRAAQDICESVALEWSAMLSFAGIDADSLPRGVPHPDWLDRYTKELSQLLPLHPTAQEG